jgi:acyl-CoA thioesterase FadM
VVEVTEVRPASLRFDYRIERGDVRIAEGFTRHACIATDGGRPTRLPRELADKL